MTFEWDLAKAQENLEKHGISFDLAARALRDPLAIEDLDDRDDYGEERIRSTAMADGIVLRIVYTIREDRIRIISARKATRHEENDYYLENGT
jgi:hypothetical protein